MAADAGEVARALASEGAAVVIVGDAAAAGALAGEVEEAGGRASVFAGDVTRDDDRAALAEMLAELF